MFTIKKIIFAATLLSLTLTMTPAKDDNKTQSPIPQELQFALMKNNVNTLKALIKKGVQIPNEALLGALYGFVAGNGQVEINILLNNKKPDSNKIISSICNQIDNTKQIIHVLLKAGSNPNFQVNLDMPIGKFEGSLLSFVNKMKDIITQMAYPDIIKAIEEKKGKKIDKQIVEASRKKVEAKFNEIAILLKEYGATV